MKDFIAPQPVNIANCGSVVIRKQTDPDENPNATTFSYTSTLVADPADSIGCLIHASGRRFEDRLECRRRDGLHGH